MPQHDESHIRLNGGIVVWDDLTQPSVIKDGPKAGRPKWSLKCVFPPSCPDLALFDALSQKTLAESVYFKGVLPPGGLMPIVKVVPGEFQDMFVGWFKINFNTTLRAPDVYDENTQLLDPMQYNSMIYTGQKVDIVAHCYDYQNKARGVAGGLDGVLIHSSENAPKLFFGTGGVNTSEAFGAPAGQQQQPAQGYQQPTQNPLQPTYDQATVQQPAQGYQPPTQNPLQPTYDQATVQQPAQGYQPPTQTQPQQSPAYSPQQSVQGHQPVQTQQQPAQGYQPPAQTQQQPTYDQATVQPPTQNQQPPAQGQPQQQQPQQATDFLPAQQ